MLNRGITQIYQVSYWQDTKTAENSLFLFDFTRSNYPPIIANSVLDAANKLYLKITNKPFAEINISQQEAFIRRLSTVKVYPPNYIDNAYKRTSQHV